MYWYSYFLDFLIGFIAGFVATLWIFYIQFKRSVSWSNLKKIEIATRELHNEIFNIESKTVTETSTSIIRSQYRSYLSVYIDLLFTSFGGGSLPKKTDGDKAIYPCLIHYEKSGNDFEDGWLKFQIEVKHLIDPASAYTFLTRIFPIKYCKSLRKAKVLAELLNQIESVVGFHDGLLHDPICRESIKIIDPETATKFTVLNKPENRQNLFKDFEKELGTLENNWHRWIKILEI